MVWITAPYRIELQCGSRGIARSRRTPKKQARPQAGSREPGHLQGIHILPLLERQTRPLDRAAAQNGVPAAV